MPLAWASGYSSDETPSLATSICRRRGLKNGQKTKKKKRVNICADTTGTSSGMDRYTGLPPQVPSLCPSGNPPALLFLPGLLPPTRAQESKWQSTLLPSVSPPLVCTLHHPIRPHSQNPVQRRKDYNFANISKRLRMLPHSTCVARIRSHAPETSPACGLILRRHQQKTILLIVLLLCSAFTHKQMLELYPLESLQSCLILFKLLHSVLCPEEGIHPGLFIFALLINISLFPVFHTVSQTILQSTSLRPYVIASLG